MTIVINNGTWEMFVETGSVDAYLNYIDVNKNDTNVGSDNRVESDKINGNGVILDEDQRLR